MAGKHDPLCLSFHPRNPISFSAFCFQGNGGHATQCFKRVECDGDETVETGGGGGGAGAKRFRKNFPVRDLKK